MWRRYGDYLFTILVLCVFTLEAVGLAGLTSVFLARMFGFLPYAQLFTALVGTVVVTALSLVILSAYIVVYHGLSERRQIARHAQTVFWTDRLVAHLYDGVALDAVEFPLVAAEALVDLRERVKGIDAAKLTEIAVRCGVVEGLIRNLGSARLANRLDALEALAKGRFPAAIDPCLDLLDDEKPVVRWMAARTLARTVATMPPSEKRDREVDRVTSALVRAKLPSGVVEEAFVLLELAAPRGLDHVLSSPSTSKRMKRAALDAAGLLGIAEIADHIGPFLVDPDPELRAAALRYLARLPSRTARLEEVVLLATQDPVEFVRVQAVRGLGRFPAREVLDVLCDRLGDISWSVRRAAAETLSAVPDGGFAALQLAGLAHPDRYAREMALVTVAEMHPGAAS